MTAKGMTWEARQNAAIGHQLGRAIESAGVTVRTVAKASGVPEARLNKLVAGKAGMSLPEAAVLCMALDLEPITLVRAVTAA